jgi:amino acid permease
MNKSKKIFLAAATVFMVIVFIVMWDMSRKTTSPYERMKMRQDQERLENIEEKDTLQQESIYAQ